MNEIQEKESVSHQVLARLYSDYEYYAQYNLKIRTKSGSVEPFSLNQAQKYLHERAQKQLEETGKVRIIVLKGRQMGISTYIEGRLYWRTSMNKARQAFILTHLDDATKNLYQMVRRFYDLSGIKPSVGSSPGRELSFDKLDSGYGLGTANNKDVGRSATVNYFHGSEVAFWANAPDHAKGALQTVPDLPGTEIFLESTANGVGNYFHEQCMKAIKGDTEYELVFIPWYWMDEYRSDVPEGFSPDDDEIDLINLYGLDEQQLVWRRKKIASLSEGGTNGELAFKQEYPNSVQEAFDTSGDDETLIKSIDAAKARKATANEHGGLAMGIDPARFGNDRSSIIFRRGRVAFGLESHKKKSTMQIANISHLLIEKMKPVKVFVDVSGLGAGVVDRLEELGHRNIVSVNNGETAIDEDRYANKGAECWGEMNLWLKDQPCKIPDSESLQADLCGRRYKVDSKGRLVLERKEDMKKRGIPSPDEADALALTFAEPVVDYTDDVSAKLYGSSGSSGWMGG